MRLAMLNSLSGECTQTLAETAVAGEAMLKLEAHVLCDLPGALDGGRHTGLREVHQLFVVSEVLASQLRMSIQTQPTSDQPVKMADEKVGEIERAGLGLTQLREIP
jgi:hypothetical protein